MITNPHVYVKMIAGSGNGVRPSRNVDSFEGRSSSYCAGAGHADGGKEPQLKYMMLLYVTEEDMGEPAPGVMDAHLSVTREAIERGAYVACDALEPTASAVRVRVRDGKVVRTDGPFAETKEIMGGFYVFDCKDIEEAVELAAKIPSPPHGCIEIRRVALIPGWEESVAQMRAATRAAHA